MVARPVVLGGAQMKPRTYFRYRNALTGRFCSAKFADRHRAITLRERVRWTPKEQPNERVVTR